YLVPLEFAYSSFVLFYIHTLPSLYLSSLSKRKLRKFSGFSGNGQLCPVYPAPVPRTRALLRRWATDSRVLTAGPCAAVRVPRLGSERPPVFHQHAVKRQSVSGQRLTATSAVFPRHFLKEAWSSGV